MAQDRPGFRMFTLPWIR